MQIFIYCKVILRVLDVTADRDSSPDQASLEGSNCTDIMTCPEAAVTVFSIPDDVCCDTRNM